MFDARRDDVGLLDFVLDLVALVDEVAVVVRDRETAVAVGRGVGRTGTTRLVVVLGGGGVGDELGVVGSAATGGGTASTEEVIELTCGDTAGGTSAAVDRFAQSSSPPARDATPASTQANVAFDGPLGVTVDRAAAGGGTRWSRPGAGGDHPWKPPGGCPGPG